MDKVCERCGGAGVLPGKDEFTSRQCICAYARALKIHLGPEVVGAPAIYESPLYVPSKEGPAEVDRTNKNLLITGLWREILPHVRLALIAKGLRFRFRITTDEKLKTIYVGSEAYSQRSRKNRDDVESFNSLGDFIGPDFDLVIIRLGFLGHKNIAMPGIIKETLLLREAAQKPTWLVDSPSVPFGPGHRAWNEEVADYVNSSFESMTLNGLSDVRPPSVEEPSEPIVETSIGNQTKEELEEPVQQEYAPTPRFDDDMMSIAGGATKKFKGGGSGWKPKKRGGGGPV